MHIIYLNSIYRVLEISNLRFYKSSAVRQIIYMGLNPAQLGRDLVLLGWPRHAFGSDGLNLDLCLGSKTLTLNGPIQWVPISHFISRQSFPIYPFIVVVLLQGLSINKGFLLVLLHRLYLSNTQFERYMKSCAFKGKKDISL